MFTPFVISLTPMIIIWGKKVVRKSAGHAAHFCPVCREVGWFRVVRVVRVPHLYYVPAGRAQPLYAEHCCKRCGVPQAFDLDVVTRASLGRPPKEPASEQAAEQTTPWDLDALRRRLEVERRARSSRLTSAEREALLAEPFLSLEYFMTVRAQRGAQESVSAVIAAMAIIGLFASAVRGYEWVESRRPSTSLTLGFFGTAGATLVFLGVAVYRGLRSEQNTVRRDLLGPVARSLAPLQPTRSELDATMRAIAAQGSTIAKHLRVDDIMNRLDAMALRPDSRRR